MFRSILDFKDEFTDVTLFGNDSKDVNCFKVGDSKSGKGIKANKIILATASPYFRSKLKTCSELRFSLLSEEDLELMIRLIYKGEIEVDAAKLERCEEVIDLLSITIQRTLGRKMKPAAGTASEQSKLHLR